MMKLTAKQMAILQTLQRLQTGGEAEVTSGALNLALGRPAESAGTLGRSLSCLQRAGYLVACKRGRIRFWRLGPLADQLQDQGEL